MLRSQKVTQSSLFTKKNKSTIELIMDHAQAGNISEVNNILNKAKESEKQTLLNLAGKKFAENGHKKEAMAMINKGADVTFVAIGFSPKDSFALKTQLAILPTEKQLVLLNSIAFEWAKSNYITDVNKLLLEHPNVAKQEVILGYVHGGHVTAANTLCGSLKHVNEERKLFLTKVMAYGYAANGHYAALVSLIKNPPFILKTHYKDEILEGAVDGLIYGIGDYVNMGIDEKLANIPNAVIRQTLSLKINDKLQENTNKSNFKR